MRHIHILISLIILALCSATAAAQKSRTISGSPGGEEGAAKTFKPGDAWKISYPLGTHEESTIDTLLYNYQRQSIPALVSDAWATTGNLGAEGINMIFWDRQPRSTFFFKDALSAWLPSFREQKFYNVYIPMTLVSYNFGGNKDNHQDRLQATFAGNVNKKIGVGAFIDYLYSKGSYTAQSTKDLSFGFSGYYTGDRYEMQAFAYHYNFLNKENGGITNDLYVTDPGQLQGGVDKIEPQSIPVRLTAAHNRINGNQLFMTHAYKLGFWKDNPEAQEGDSTNLEIFVPVTKFIYSLDYNDAHRYFINTNASQGDSFWDNRYLYEDGTWDNTRYSSLTNTVGISMIEGFQTWAKFGLSAYASYEHRRFTQASYYKRENDSSNEQGTKANDTDRLTPLPEGFVCPPKASQNLLWIGGRLEKEKGSLLRYHADARFGLLGDVVGDLDIEGKATTNIKMLGDMVSISAAGYFRNTAPSYLLDHYISNHFAWDNSFGKTRRFRAGGELYIPWTRTRLEAGVENIQNYIYFDSISMPRQHGGNIQVFTARLDQKLNFGIWNWNNTLTYQTTSDKDILPLPSLAIYSNMYLAFRAFNVLDLQIGVDCDYYTSYRALNYQPATMTFHVQNPENAVKVGNYPLCDVYVTGKLSKVRFFVVWSHVNQGMFSKNYFSLPHYPINPRRLQLGLSVDFAD